ncbi:UNVERIFIED_CONTAM: hypothetical protein FKN15_018432 [Acipenser sinensis]
MAGVKFVPEGRASVFSFVLGLGAICIPLLSAAGSDIAWVQTLLLGIRTKIAIAVYVTSVNGLLLVLYKGPVYQVAVRACFLGFTFGCGLLVSFSKTSWGPFGWYMCSLSFFHYSEYLVTAIINPRSLSLDSFLLNHSLEYKVAAVSSWVEFTVEKLLFPGQSVLLCNPLCVLGYALASWRFFRERIDEEEITLIHFFGEDYLEYKSKVPTGLPFITGIKMEP